MYHGKEVTRVMPGNTNANIANNNSSRKKRVAVFPARRKFATRGIGSNKSMAFKPVAPGHKESRKTRRRTRRHH